MNMGVSEDICCTNFAQKLTKAGAKVVHCTRIPCEEGQHEEVDTIANYTPSEEN